MVTSTEITNGVLEAWRARNHDRVASFYGENVEVIGPGGILIRGREAAREYVRGWGEAFFDLQRIIHRSYESGPVVVTEGTFIGTHTGDLYISPGVAVRPTGNRVKIRFCEVFVIEGGVVVRNRLYFDQVELLAQLGVFPPHA